jgi:acetyltransferase
VTFERLFEPRGVAVVGASQNPTKLGYGVARNLVVSGYKGALHFVNPRGGRLFDRPLRGGLLEVPDPVDVAVILIPAASVPGVLEDCGQRGIPYAVIGSGGFREVGEQGRQLEDRCLEIARRYGIRVLGPNCVGFLDTHLPIDTTFLPLPGPIPGDIAFLSHSGAICEAVIDWARGQGFGLSRLISLGNQMDLTEADMLPPTAEDEETRVIAMYLEGVGDGRAFIRQARRVAAGKPVVAIKVGRSEHGRAAVASHTGALAGEDRAYEAAFRKAGILRAKSSEEVFDWARALAWCPLPRGARMAVLTNAGGPGAIAVDSLDEQGLELSALGSDTLDRLQDELPPAASLRNPVDMLASAGPAEYANCLRALLRDEGVDGVMVILPPPPMTTAAEVAGAIIPVIQSSSKPVVVALMGEDLITHAARLFRQARVPDYRFPERAASALAALVQRAEQLKRPGESKPAPLGVERQEALETLAGARPGREGLLPAALAARLVQAYGIAVPQEQRAHTAQEAAARASELGFPVALKVLSPDLVHKSDVGGVALGLGDEASVRVAYDRLVGSVQRAVPEAEIEGVTVQQMVSEGQDVIVGVIQDAQFGPLVMFGSGGVEVEALDDVTFALAPLTRTAAEDMLTRTWAGRRLAGFRGLPAADREAALEALLRIGRLGEGLPQIVELEINPLRVLPGGGGAVALDVRARMAGPEGGAV